MDAWRIKGIIRLAGAIARICGGPHVESIQSAADIPTRPIYFDEGIDCANHVAQDPRIKDRQVHTSRRVYQAPAIDARCLHISASGIDPFASLPSFDRGVSRAF
jgi:hypothetical protein